MPWIGCSPRRTAFEMFSGPAHNVDGSPPSRASAATAPLREASASSRKALYRLDFPVPLAPVTTFNRRNGMTNRRSDR